MARTIVLGLRLGLLGVGLMGCSPSVTSPSTTPQPDDAAALEEVVGLHRFFAQWFRGEVTADDEGFAPLPKALAADFVLVSPRGTTLDRDATLTGVRGAHGRWASDDAIWVEDVRVVQRSAETIVAHYHEWQRRGGEVNGRISTVIFDARLQWRHVHETWLPAGTEPTSTPR